VKSKLRTVSLKQSYWQLDKIDSNPSHDSMKESKSKLKSKCH